MSEPYEDTALRLALESALTEVSETHHVSEEMKRRIRGCFVKAMNESLLSISSKQSVYIRSSVDPTGEYPVYRVEDGRADIYLKDVEVTTTSEFGDSKDVIKADFLKLNVFPGTQVESGTNS